MKKLFFLLFLPIWGFGGFAFAQSTVTVMPIGTDYGEHTVTFRVAWSGTAHNNRVWIWVDYCSIAGVAPASTFSPAFVGAVTITASNGDVTTSTGSTRGFFVAQNPATVTATLLDATGQFNWCAYGSSDPPKAAVKADGGYILQGAPPFTINGTITEHTKTFGAGTCITSITDFTGNPEGVVPALPSLSDPNSPSICSGGAVTLFVTAGGGITGAMTYTWDIGVSQDSNQTNSYTTASLPASATYSVTATNANNCKSSPATGTITVNYPGTDGQPAHPVCGCAEGTADCGSTCKTIRYYATNDGACTGVCSTGYVQLRNQCGDVVHTKYAKALNYSCAMPCEPADLASRTLGEFELAVSTGSACLDTCRNLAHKYKAPAFNVWYLRCAFTTMPCKCRLSELTIN